MKKLAARERNIVFIMGKKDYLSDGERTFVVKSGYLYLGYITGSGCTLGTTIAAFLAVYKEDKLLTSLAGILMYEIAAEQVGKRADVKGPGTFVPAFLDQLYEIAQSVGRDDSEWLKAANIERLGD